MLGAAVLWKLTLMFAGRSWVAGHSSIIDTLKRNMQCPRNTHLPSLPDIDNTLQASPSNDHTLH